MRPPDNERGRPAKAAPTVSTAISTETSLTAGSREQPAGEIPPLPDPADGGDYGPQEDYDPARLEVYDRDALAECETVIERGLETFYAIGRSLLTIRDRRLYREQYGTFEDYLRDRWGIDRTYANRLIQSAKVVETLPIGNTPTSEAQSRELVPLLMAGQPEEVRRVWAEANERTNGKPTAAAIRQVREELGNTPPDASTPRPEPSKSRRSSFPDAYRSALWELDKAARRLEKLHADDRFLRHRDDLRGLWRLLDEIRSAVNDFECDLTGGANTCSECGERRLPSRQNEHRCDDCRGDYGGAR